MDLDGMKKVEPNQVYFDTTKEGWKNDALNFIDILTRQEYIVVSYYEEDGFIVEFELADMRQYGGPVNVWVEEDYE